MIADTERTITNPSLTRDFETNSWRVECDVALHTPGHDPEAMHLHLSFRIDNPPATSSEAFRDMVVGLLHNRLALPRGVNPVWKELPRAETVQASHDDP